MKKLPIPHLERLQQIIPPLAVSVAVVAGLIISTIEIRRENARRRRWIIPLLVIGGLLLAGFVGAIVEYAILAQPRPVTTHLTLP